MQRERERETGRVVDHLPCLSNHCRESGEEKTIDDEYPPFTMLAGRNSLLFSSLFPSICQRTANVQMRLCVCSRDQTLDKPATMSEMELIRGDKQKAKRRM